MFLGLALRREKTKELFVTPSKRLRSSTKSESLQEDCVGSMIRPNLLLVFQGYEYKRAQLTATEDNVCTILPNNAAEACSRRRALHKIYFHTSYSEL